MNKEVNHYIFMFHLIIIEHVNELPKVLLTSDGIISNELCDLVTKVI